MTESKKLANSESIVQKIIADIRNDLTVKVLQPGDKLPSEIQLVAKYSVSRNAVREAIKMLVALGVVEIRRGEGTYIVESISTPMIDPFIFNLLLTRGTPRELLEFRQMLEIGILDIVMKKVVAADICKMESAIELLREDYQKGEIHREVLAKHDLDFHYAFVGAAHNPFIMNVARVIWEMFRPSIQKSVRSRTKNTVERHKMILQAIKERNLEKAKEVLYLSLEEWGQNLS